MNELWMVTQENKVILVGPEDICKKTASTYKGRIASPLYDKYDFHIWEQLAARAEESGEPFKYFWSMLADPTKAIPIHWSEAPTLD